MDEPCAVCGEPSVVRVTGNEKDADGYYVARPLCSKHYHSEYPPEKDQLPNPPLAQQSRPEETCPKCSEQMYRWNLKDPKTAMCINQDCRNFGSPEYRAQHMDRGWNNPDEDRQPLSEGGEPPMKPEASTEKDPADDLAKTEYEREHELAPNAGASLPQKGETWVSKNNPEAHVTITDIQDRQVVFYPAGGGMQRSAPFEVFQQHFQLLQSDGDALVPSVFSMEGIDQQFPGFRYPGQYWNGWAVPYFTKDVAAQVLASLGGPTSFDEANDSFQWSPIDHDDEPYTYQGQTVGDQHLYCLDGLIWDEVTSKTASGGILFKVQRMSDEQFPEPTEDLFHINIPIEAFVQGYDALERIGRQELIRRNLIDPSAKWSTGDGDDTFWMAFYGNQGFGFTNLGEQDSLDAQAASDFITFEVYRYEDGSPDPYASNLKVTNIKVNKSTVMAGWEAVNRELLHFLKQESILTPDAREGDADGDFGNFVSWYEEGDPQYTSPNPFLFHLSQEDQDKFMAWEEGVDQQLNPQASVPEGLWLVLDGENLVSVTRSEAEGWDEVARLTDASAGWQVIPNDGRLTEQDLEHWDLGPTTLKNDPDLKWISKNLDQAFKGFNPNQPANREEWTKNEHEAQLRDIVREVLNLELGYTAEESARLAKVMVKGDQVDLTNVDLEDNDRADIVKAFMAADVPFMDKPRTKECPHSHSIPGSSCSICDNNDTNGTCTSCGKETPSTQLAGGTCRNCRPTFTNRTNNQPSTLTDSGPEDVGQMPKRDREQRLDRILDQFNKEKDPDRRQQLMTQMKSLQASLKKWATEFPKPGEKTGRWGRVANSDLDELWFIVNNDHDLYVKAWKDWAGDLKPDLVHKFFDQATNEGVTSVPAIVDWLRDNFNLINSNYLLSTKEQGGANEIADRKPNWERPEYEKDPHGDSIPRPIYGPDNGQMTIEDIPVADPNTVLDQYNEGKMDEQEFQRRMKQLNAMVNWARPLLANGILEMNEDGLNLMRSKACELLPVLDLSNYNPLKGDSTIDAELDQREALVREAMRTAAGPEEEPRSDGEKDGLYSQWGSSQCTDDLVAGYIDQLKEGDEKQPWQLEGTEFAESYASSPETLEWFKNLEMQGLMPELEEALREKAYLDYDGANWVYESFLEDFDNLINTVNPGSPKVWRVNMRNFGWMHEDGGGTITADNAKSLLQAILPNTDCSFKVYKEGRGIKINNAHHDAPTGGEMYYITPFDAEAPNPEDTPRSHQLAVAPEMADELNAHHDRQKQQTQVKDSPKPKTDFTEDQLSNAPESVSQVPTIDPKDRQRKIDNLLDQLNETEDQSRRNQLEEQIRSLRAQMQGWLKQAAGPGWATPQGGDPCSCRPGQARDNCPQCEGTGRRIDFRAHREEMKKKYPPAPSPRTNFTEEQLTYAPEFPGQVPVMDKKDLRLKMDRLLDQRNATDDPERQRQLDEQMRSLKAQMAGWLKQAQVPNGPDTGFGGVPNHPQTDELQLDADFDLESNRKIMTEDGYCFYEHADGHWSDNLDPSGEDMSWPDEASMRQMLEEEMGTTLEDAQALFQKHEKKSEAIGSEGDPQPEDHRDERQRFQDGQGEAERVYDAWQDSQEGQDSSRAVREAFPQYNGAQAADAAEFLLDELEYWATGEDSNYVMTWDQFADSKDDLYESIMAGLT